MKLTNGAFLLVTVILLLSWLRNAVKCKRILVVAPAPTFSHQINHRSFCRELHRRGHEIVVVTTYPLYNRNLPNYTEIDFSSENERVKQVKLEPVKKTLGLWQIRQNIQDFANIMAEDLLQLPDFRQLYRADSNEKFDAVIVETLFSPLFYLLARRFNAPLIGLLSMQLHNIDRYFVGSPIIPSHLSNWEVDGVVENPTFFQRLRYFFETWVCMYYWFHDFLPKQESLARKYFGENLTDIVTAGKSMSLLVANSHVLNVYARPDVPAVVYYNDAHISEVPPTLPRNVRDFLDNATDGFIYISFGATVRHDFFTEETKALLTIVASKLPWPVVWRRDDAKTVPELWQYRDKVYISEWFPQQGVLAHPNIKLFVYQGGLQSSQEAIHYGVPVLGIPIMFDQEHNVRRLESFGAGRYITLSNLTESNFYGTIHEMVHNTRYKKNMLELAKLSKDVPYNSLKNVAWWIEYVIRNKGAPHLQFTNKHMPLYQQYNIDIIVFLTMATNFIIGILLGVILIVVLYIIKRCPRLYLVCLIKKDKEKRN